LVSFMGELHPEWGWRHLDSQDRALHLSLAFSRPATGLSAPDPAQRAGAQRLCAVAPCDGYCAATECPLL